MSGWNLLELAGILLTLQRIARRECTELKRQIAEGLKKRKRAEALSKATKVLEEGRGGWGKKS